RSPGSVTAICSGLMPKKEHWPISATRRPFWPAPRLPKALNTSISAWAANCLPVSANWWAPPIGERAFLAKPTSQPELTLMVVPAFSPVCNLGFALRREVFILEQGVPEDIEHDADDL